MAAAGLKDYDVELSKLVFDNLRSTETFAFDIESVRHSYQDAGSGQNYEVRKQ